jgi:hypothetical protein
MERKERIVKMARDEFPGSTVVFDENFGGFVRFRIEDRSGNVLSKAFPHFLPGEIDDWPEERLRKVVRGMCGL